MSPVRPIHRSVGLVWPFGPSQFWAPNRSCDTKLVYNLPACSWWELAAVPLSSRPWWSPMVAPSAPSRCARRGSCPAAEQSAPWSSPAPYLAFFWSAFLSLNYGCVVSMPGLVELRAGSLSFSSRPAQLDSRSSSPFPLRCRGSWPLLLGFSGARDLPAMSPHQWSPRRVL
jgi:hypothetical protein